MFKVKKEICIIVDGVSTGKYLAPELRKRGINCIHLFSKKDVSKFFLKTFNEKDYLQCFYFENNFSEILDALKEYKVLRVIPGVDSAVTIADLLSSELGCAGNSVQTSKNRIDKYMMSEALATAGVKRINHFHSSHTRRYFGMDRPAEHISLCGQACSERGN